MGFCTTAVWFMEYVWVTGVQASHVRAKFSQQCFYVCILEPLPSQRFINHHLRVPETGTAKQQRRCGGQAQLTQHQLYDKVIRLAETRLAQNNPPRGLWHGGGEQIHDRGPHEPNRRPAPLCLEGARHAPPHEGRAAVGFIRVFVCIYIYIYIYMYVILYYIIS